LPTTTVATVGAEVVSGIVSKRSRYLRTNIRLRDQAESKVGMRTPPSLFVDLDQGARNYPGTATYKGSETCSSVRAITLTTGVVIKPRRQAADNAATRLLTFSLR
jgi:hypothetical protein